MNSTQKTYRLGIDIGGTFTDIVLMGNDGTVLTQKVPSTPDDYARGIIEGLGPVLPRQIAESLPVCLIHAYVLRSAARNQGIRAHQHHCHQRGTPAHHRTLLTHTVRTTDRDV